MNTNLIEGLSNLQPTDLDAGQVFALQTVEDATIVRRYKRGYVVRGEDV